MNKITFTKEYTKERYNPFYEEVKRVALFMGEPKMIGKWQFICRGIPHIKLYSWMLDAEKAHNPPDWTMQKLFNISKKKYLNSKLKTVI